MQISKFLLDKSSQVLTIEYTLTDTQTTDQIAKIESEQLSFEYLRISSPNEVRDNTKQGQTKVVCHKKEVNLVNIESVAKHGYRFIFDDAHNAIYSENYILTLIQEHDSRWQEYLIELKASGHSRETMINFKQL